MCSDPDVSQRAQCQQRPLNCKSLHRSRQKLASTLYRCFLAQIQSLLPAQTRDF